MMEQEAMQAELVAAPVVRRARPEPGRLNYYGEFIHASTGETEDDGYYARTVMEVIAKLKTMEDGDCLTINCRAESPHAGMTPIL